MQDDKNESHVEGMNGCISVAWQDLGVCPK